MNTLLRCALLRPDPSKADRLEIIIANLTDRIAEAEQNSWLGEVEGLKISLTGAEDKLAQMKQPLMSNSVDLGLPEAAPSRTGRKR